VTKPVVFYDATTTTTTVKTRSRPSFYRRPREDPAGSRYRRHSPREKKMHRFSFYVS